MNRLLNMLFLLSSTDSTLCATFQSFPIRDTVRDCLEKEPSERTEHDIGVLMDFMQHFKVCDRAVLNISSIVSHSTYIDFMNVIV